MVESREPAPRIREPQRLQGELRFEIPDAMVSSTHPARLIWEVLGRLDLSRFAKGCSAVEGRAGRSLLSPRMLLTLWMYAISQAIGSAREIARLTTTDVAYRWIVGDLSLTHHKLSAFRVAHGEGLNRLLTDVLASLMEKGLLSLSLVAQDGTRTRAAATAPSFRTYGSLLECREQAALHLKAVLASAENPQYTRGQHAARAAEARDFQTRVESAIATVNELQKTRSPTDKPARASTTDAEARIMKMADGGFRPAYNIQYAVAGSEMGGPRTIVGVHVSNIGGDMGSITPMAEQIKTRTGQVPTVLLADGGHAKHEDIARARRMGIDVLVPPRNGAKPIKQMLDADPEVIAWRKRMEEPEAKQLYRARASLAELANAKQKTQQGLTQLLLRGIDKVTCVVLMGAIASNILQHAHKLLA